MSDEKPRGWSIFRGKKEPVDPIRQLSDKIAARETHSTRIGNFLAGIGQDEHVAKEVIENCDLRTQGHQMNLAETRTRKLQTEAAINEVNEGIERIQKITVEEAVDPEFPDDDQITMTGQEIAAIPTAAEILESTRETLEHALSITNTIIDRENQNVLRINEVRDRAETVINTGANLRTSLTIAKTITEAGITPEDFATAIKALVEKSKKEPDKPEKN